MIKHAAREHPPTERRRFERVDIARNSQVLVLEAKGKKVGVLRQIGRGGFMMEPEKTYSKDDKAHKLTIHEPGEELSIEVKARVLYSDHQFVGFEFVDLDPDAAVEVGIIIGKFYEANHEP
ncbi:MAG TPA: PilZ domain-containing protein [Candidatus Angelobacter sp.]